MTQALPEDLLKPLQQVGLAVGGNLKAFYFPEDGPFARRLYPKSMDFLEATGSGLYKVLSIFGGNRTSKTFTPCYAIACWLTGEYPDWWDEIGALRFQKPVRILCAGQTGVLVRNALQRYLIGSKEMLGQNSLIKATQIKHVSWHAKPHGLAESALIAGRYGDSYVEFRSYDAHRARFQSDEWDVVLLDEEPPFGVFTEAVTRTGTRKGIVINAFTALEGVTPLVAMLLPQFAGGQEPDDDYQLEVARWHCFVGWDDIPYAQLSKEERKRLRSQFPSHEVTARTTGIPSVGSGMVWPVAESDILVPALRVPDDWPRLVTLDPGFEHGTGAGLWAVDQDAGALYLISDYWKRLEHYAVHCDRITQWGDWIPVVMDYASGQNPDDGEAVKTKYRKRLKNPVFNANKAFSAGSGEVLDMMRDGRFFVFDTCRHWIGQFRQYVRNAKGKIAMPDDPNDANRHHFELMDCSRYAALGIHHAQIMPAAARSERARFLPAREDAEYGGVQTVDMTQGYFR